MRKKHTNRMEQEQEELLFEVDGSRIVVHKGKRKRRNYYVVHKGRRLNPATRRLNPATRRLNPATSTLWVHDSVTYI